jgi:hypothetical protein
MNYRPYSNVASGKCLTVNLFYDCLSHRGPTQDLGTGTHLHSSCPKQSLLFSSQGFLLVILMYIYGGCVLYIANFLCPFFVRSEIKTQEKNERKQSQNFLRFHTI